MHNERSAGLVLQSMSVHGNNYHSPQMSPSLLPGPASSSLVASPVRQRSRNRPSSATSKKHCNCKNSRCLKLYCECFASGRYCDGCNCVNCCNNMENEATRQSAVEAILERNPNAFRPKIQAGASEEGLAAGNARHNKGCNCKKSGCLKKYCECFQAGIYCGDNCKCIDCKNFEGSEAREAVAMTAFQPQDMPSRHHQPLPHHSPAQTNKRQRLVPPHSMHRQPHPPLPSIPVNTRQPLPAIPEMVSRGMQQGSRSRMGQARGDPRTQAINSMLAGPQLGGPLGAALSMRPSAPPQADGYFRDTMHEMFKRGTIDEVCALLVSVAQEQAEPSSLPAGHSGPQGTTESGLLPSATAAGQMPDGSLQPSSLVTDGTDQTSEPGGGVSKLYEAQERAVLSEYHEVLLKLVDRATQKQKDAQQPGGLSRPARDFPAPHPAPTPAASRPLSAPATLADGSQQHLMHGSATQGLDTSSAFEQLQQSRLLTQQQPQQQQQRQLAAASQSPAGAAYIPTASSSFLAPNRFGGNSSAGMHLPLGVSHLESDGYLSNPGPSGLSHPVQTGMGLPGQLGFGSAQAMGLGHPVQTGMGSPSHSTGLYQRPASAQPLGSRQSMQAGLHARPGSHIGSMSNPLGPNQQHPSNGPLSEGLRPTAQLPPMQLPVGSMLTNAPIQSMSHLPAQLQTQRHLQQQLPNSRLYQSFSDALAEPSQNLNGLSMHSMVSHAPSQSLYSQQQQQQQQPQGLSSNNQNTSTMPQGSATQQPHMQTSSSMHHLGQGFSTQPQGSAMQQPQSHEQSSSSMHHLGQGLSSQALSKAADAGSGMHSSAGLSLPSGAALLPSLPDGSAQVSTHFPGSLSASLQEQ